MKIGMTLNHEVIIMALKSCRQLKHNDFYLMQITLLILCGFCSLCPPKENMTWTTEVVIITSLFS